MDETTLKTLTEASRAAPENSALLVVVLEAYRSRGESDTAFALVVHREAQSFSNAAERRVVAEVCLSAGHPEVALRFTDDPDPKNAILRARILLALGRRDDAREAYRRAVTESSALEDRDLAAELESRVREVAQTEGRLRVISNDNTDAFEVQRLLFTPADRVTFDDVGGLEPIKRQIHRRIVLPFKKPGLFQRFKKKVGGGILLYGPPGCGKTLLARATAGECDATFLNVEISDVLEMYIGESEQKLHALFERARACAPSVLFFDEVEALGGKRQYTREGMSSRLVSQFLSEMDGFARNNQGVLVLGVTNTPWAVDPAFRRPGRFDRVLFVPPPDREARTRILEILLKDRPTEGDLGLRALAQATSGYSGADLAHLVESAADVVIERSIARGEDIPVTKDVLRQALTEVKPTTLEWLTTARNYARYANEGGQYDEVLAFLQAHGRAGS